MPGIAGLISRRPPEECTAIVDAMVATMHHEAFYATSRLQEPALGFYGGMVAHPGSFALRQRRADGAAPVDVLFAGECFPDEQAAESGWVAAQYEKHGDEFARHLNGLFSGWVIDRRRRRALLCNDRYGIERLYFFDGGDAVYFASEAKALLQVVPALRQFDDAGVAQFLAFGCTLDWQTLFRGMTLLPGATRVRFEADGTARRDTYFHAAEWEVQEPLGEREFDTAFAEVFPRILRRYLRGDGPIGVSLTGGLDTRMIMACLPAPAPALTCYTFSGPTENTLDARIAARIAALQGLHHDVLRIDRDFLDNFGRHVDRTVLLSDGCAGATGAHEIFFNAAARPLSPVRVTGNFGSEVLRGMSTFKPAGLAPGILNDTTRSAVEAAARRAPSGAIHPVTFATFREIPWNLFGTLAAGRTQVTFRTPYLDNEVVALAYRAPAHLRTSPLSALRLVRRHHPGLAAIATDRGQIGESRGLAWFARRVFAEVSFKLDYMHKEGLPSALAPFAPVLNLLAHTPLLGLHKFLAYRRWFQRDAAEAVAAVLLDARTRDLPYFDGAALEPMFRAHVSGRSNHVREINAVLTLEAVNRLLLQRPVPSRLPPLAVSSAA